jgi:DNA-binding transcriptional ArsR family regulator
MAVWQETESSSAVFRALSDATRRTILVALSDGELSAGQIAALFPISGPSVSRHLTVLKASGLVSERRSANRVIYTLQGAMLHQALTAYVDATAAPVPAGSAPHKKKAKPAGGKPKKKLGNHKSAKAQRAADDLGPLVGQASDHPSAPTVPAELSLHTYQHRPTGPATAPVLGNAFLDQD